MPEHHRVGAARPGDFLNSLSLQQKYTSMETRILVALGLIAGVIVFSAVAGTVTLRRRRRERLRRRGIKTHGH